MYIMWVTTTDAFLGILCAQAGDSQCMKKIVVVSGPEFEGASIRLEILESPISDFSKAFTKQVRVSGLQQLVEFLKKLPQYHNVMLVTAKGFTAICGLPSCDFVSSTGVIHACTLPTRFQKRHMELNWNVRNLWSCGV
jgi:hypothetical protein